MKKKVARTDSLKEIAEYIEKNIYIFHDSRINCLQNTDLKDLLKRKNPYLFRAKNILTAQELVSAFLEARLSSSEEEIFGRFLEDLAIFVAHKFLNATKSATQGIDFEYTTGNIRYLFIIKSGLNWGNSSQWKALERDVSTAIKILHQSRSIKHVQPFLGVCYGNAKTTTKKGAIKQICGQAFWAMISGNTELYKEIIIPLGHNAKERNEEFNKRKAEIINVFTREVLNNYCDSSGKLDWKKIVELSSKNM